MAKLDKEELKKLSPEERIARLKKLEEEHKNDLREAEKIISESIEELEVQRSKPDEEPEMQRRLPEELDLEQVLQKEEPKPENIEGNVQYTITQYNELAEIAEEAVSGGYVNRARAEQLYRSLLQSESNMGQNQVVKEIAEGSRRLMKELLGSYAARQDYRPDGSVQ
jgi:hypothetical protein